MITNKQKDNIIKLCPQRLGQVRYNSKGEKGEVIGFKENSTYLVLVRINDGEEIIQVKWPKFNEGIFHILSRESHLGESKLNKQGLNMTIIEYRKYDDLDVRFDSGYVRKHSNYDLFKRGDISDYFYPSFVNIGYLGDGKYDGYFQIDSIKPMQVWANMLRRCYDPQEAEMNRYSDCQVETEWHNYQNFADWCVHNAYSIGEIKMELDKDLLIKNNRIYGPDRCCFLPREINDNIIRGRKNRKQNRIERNKELPVGVTYDCHSPNYPFRVHIGRKRLGSLTKNFNTLEEAFAFYKREKEAYIKYIADIYKDQIPQKIYDALYAYEIEITD